MGWLHFDGVDDYVEIPRTNFPTITNKVTLIVCVKLDVLREMEPAIFLGNTNYQAWIWTPRYEDGRLEFGVYTDTSYYTQTGRKIETGKCYCVALTYDGDLASNNLKGYVNGELWTQRDATGDLRASTEPVYLAYFNDKYLKGNHYFAAFYNRPLDDEEISQVCNYLMNGEGEMITDGLVLWLDGDSIDPANGIWRDKSGNGNDGIIYGATYIEPIMKVWDGSAWKDIQSIYYWNGTSWCLPKNVFYWDGSRWVSFWTPPYEVIWYSDESAQKVYELSTADFSVIRSASSPAEHPVGIGGDTDTIWHCDYVADKVYELSTSDFSVIRSASSPYTTAYGIGGDTDTIWHCDNNADKVYELSTSDFSVIRSASSPGNMPWDIGGDADTIWHCDYNAHKVYELSTSDFSVIRSASSPDVQALAGIGGDINTIWHAGWYEKKVYELSTSDFSVIRSASSPTGDPTGIGGK